MSQSTTPITVTALGDFIFLDRPAPAALAAVAGLVGDADLTLGNVDVALTDQGTPAPKWAALRADPAIAGDLRAMGLDLAVLANNHAMDYRATGLTDSLAHYAAAGLGTVGAGANLTQALAPAITRTPTGSVATVALCSTLPPDAAATATDSGVAPLRVRQAYAIDESLAQEQPGSVPEVRTWPDPADLAQAVAAVTAARAAADHVLVVIHWGVPRFWRSPSHPPLQASQRLTAHALIEAGASAIIGNHAHELHPVEFHRGRPILYCLGNFWIDQLPRWPWMGREAVIARLTLSPTGDCRVSLRPILLNDAGLPEAVAPERVLPLLQSPDPASGRFQISGPTIDALPNNATA